MRIRNVKNAKDIIKESSYVVKENPFNDSKPLHIEIGMGKGDFIIRMAKNYPEINFIGIERYESIMVRALKKIDEPLDNLRFMCMDALNISDVFNHNVNQIYLNFSDPWPKKRHAKRRLTSDTFLNIYELISKDNVKIKMKTDNKSLFAYSLMSLNNNGYVFDDVKLDLEEDYNNNVVTEYESKFRKIGVNINYLEAHKVIKK